MKKLKLIWDWLVRSSANAQNISLMIKGIGTALIPTVLILTKAFNVDVADDKLRMIIDGLATIVIVGSSVIAAIQVAIGAIRKVLTTFTGTNAVIAQYNKTK